MPEDEMIGWHHRLNGHEFGWTLGVGDGQGGLVCCGSWGCKVRYDCVTELTLFSIVAVSISVQFSRSVVSTSLRPHGLQHTRLSYPSPTSRACSNSCPSSWRCHPTISYSVVPFSSCLQSFPATGSFPMSQFFTSGGQSITFPPKVQKQDFFDPPP